VLTRPQRGCENFPMHSTERSSIQSIGSAGSILSIGSAGSILSILSFGSAASIMSAFSRWSVRAWRGDHQRPAGSLDAAPAPGPGAPEQDQITA